MNRENKSSIETRLALTAVSRTASVTDGPIIDMRGFDSATFVIHAGTVTTADGSNGFTFSLRHGSASDLSGDAAVPAGEFDGAPAIDATTDSDKIIGTITYKGGERYVRLVGTEVGTASAIFGAVVNLSHAEQAPVA